MIFIDKTEGRAQSRLPRIPNAQYVQGLEEIGPDIMVSPLDGRFPQDKVNNYMLKKHLDAGAMLIQLKVGTDLLTSITDGRLDTSLSRMQEAVPNSWQRWLLYIGNFMMGSKSALSLDGKPQRIRYWEFNGALSAWGEGGGIIANLPTPESIPKWLNSRQDRLKQYLAEPEKKFMPKPYFPNDTGTDLRQPKPVKDGRLVLAAIPGIGPDRATALWEFFDKNVAAALCFLTDPDALEREEKPANIGPKTIQQARETLGLVDDEKLILGHDKFPVTIVWPPHFSHIVCAPGNQWEMRQDGSTVVTYNTFEEMNAILQMMRVMKEVEDDKAKT